MMKSMKPLKEKISITVDGDILEKARELAEQDDRSLSQFINIALKEYVKKIEKVSDEERIITILFWG